LVIVIFVDDIIFGWSYAGAVCIMTKVFLAIGFIAAIALVTVCCVGDCLEAYWWNDIMDVDGKGWKVMQP
jgi:hypothetical protein